MRIYTTLLAYLRSRRLNKKLNSRLIIKAYHQKKLKRLSQYLSSHIPFYSKNSLSDFHAYPVIDKQTLLSHFGKMNSHGITLNRLKSSILDGTFEVSGFKTGHSTGTSGNRGYYIISERERFVWLGTILAKTIPNALWARHNVALILPGMSSLYTAAKKGNRVNIRFFDLSLGLAAWEEELANFSPDTIVAPPKILRHLAEAKSLTAQNIFSSAEVLDPIDKTIIEKQTGKTLRQIYMATEGLLGVSCQYGTLHLAEDVVHFEWEPVPNSHLVSPIITDFTRRTQAMARYKLNDLLELSNEPCACGSAFQAVSRIEGRSDDVFHLPDAEGHLQLITPDVLRNRLIDLDDRILDFRIIQTGRDKIIIRLHDDLVPQVSDAVKNTFLKLFQGLNLGKINLVIEGGISIPFDQKLRRVRRDWSP
ncbi:MAG: F390 synthetase-related protein [Litorimonas sp.]